MTQQIERISSAKLVWTQLLWGHAGSKDFQTCSSLLQHQQQLKIDHRLHPALSRASASISLPFVLKEGGTPGGTGDCGCQRSRPCFSAQHGAGLNDCLIPACCSMLAACPYGMWLIATAALCWLKFGALPVVIQGCFCHKKRSNRQSGMCYFIHLADWSLSSFQMKLMCTILYLGQGSQISILGLAFPS